MLYDDRDASAGVKFADADLIGVPLRLTVSERAQQHGGVELKWRGREERQVLPMGSVLTTAQTEIQRVRVAASFVRDVPYPEAWTKG